MLTTPSMHRYLARCALAGALVLLAAPFAIAAERIYPPVAAANADIAAALKQARVDSLSRK